VVAARIDFVALLDLTLEIVPDSQRERAARILEVARGLLLGRDPRGEILPALGPVAVVYADAPPTAKPDQAPSLLIGVELDASKEVRPALENALRTLFNLIALDDKKSPEESRITVVERAGRTTVALGTPPAAVAYALTARRLAIGNDPDRVADFVADQGASVPERGLLATVPERITHAGGFGVVNLDRIVQRVAARRAKLAEEWNLSVQDLDGLLAAGGLFRFAYFTTTVGANSTSVRRTAGLIGRPTPR
jgi:hypothetical protein